MRLSVCILFLGALFLGNAQNTFETGKVIDSIPVSGNGNETFALYLPTSFNSEIPSPIVFIFDPAARGKIGIQPFIEASEAYQYILICSNDTKNGPYDRNFNIANRLFDFAFSNFKIKEKQIFLAGFSGGARLASAIAVLTNQIAGVIACGAGFSQNQAHIPSIQKFLFAGICGDRDMNYMEMIQAKGYLQELNFKNTLFTYDGDHSWPPSNEVLRAFDWLEIQSHLKENVRKTDAEIFNSYQSSYTMALRFENDGELIRAIENYERISLTYKSFYDVDSITSKLKKLHKNKEYKVVLKSVTKAFDKETKLTNMFNARFRMDYNDPDKSDFNWWKKELEKLKEINNVEMKKMVERVRFKIVAMAFSMKNPNLHQSNKKQIEFCNTIGKLIYPDF